MREKTLAINTGSAPKTWWLRLWFLRFRSTILSLSVLLLILISWQVSASIHLVNTLYTSSPFQILSSAYHFIPSRAGLNDMKVTGEEFGIGVGLAIILGIIFGLLLGFYPVLDEAAGLSLNLFYSMPLIALAPLFVLWFGIGLLSKVMVVLLAAIFPILVTTSSGAKNVDRGLLEVARFYNASRRQLWTTVLLPAAVPPIVSGVRLGILTGMIGVIVAEFIVSSAGIGYIIDLGSTDFNSTLTFMGLFIVVAAAGILTSVLRRIERHFSKWSMG